MEIEEATANRNPKRILVDATDTNAVLPSSKKPSVPQEIEKKVKIMKFIAYAHYRIGVEILGDRFDPMDISLGDQIHNILFTSYTVLRQRHNQTGGTLETRIAATDFKITYDKTEHTSPRANI